jgi:hypothetical protein
MWMNIIHSARIEGKNLEKENILENRFTTFSSIS